ncbi:MAG: cadherin-like beta sandwich domain-containing protein [Syntrophomonadaceae bacterium]|jgi:VCBS repeat-containing protein
MTAWSMIILNRLDATLSGLTIDPGTLSPAFDSSITDYTAAVENSVDSITLTAVLNEPHAAMALKKDGGAEVPWDGSAFVQNLSVGANVFTITVTAQDGTTRTYTVTITRKASNSGDGDDSFSPLREILTSKFFDFSHTA